MRHDPVKSHLYRQPVEVLKSACRQAGLRIDRRAKKCQLVRVLARLCTIKK